MSNLTCVALFLSCLYRTAVVLIHRPVALSSLDSEEALRRFQAGELNENDEEWHRLVPPEAVAAAAIELFEGGRAAPAAPFAFAGAVG